MLRSGALRVYAKLIAALGLLCFSVALAGCNAASPPPAASVAAAPEPPAAGVVGSAIGQSLDTRDKEVAVAAQQEAVNSGARKTWRGLHGVYGFIEPGSEGSAGPGCKEYTHKIFINGRPQEAKGKACRETDGAWRVKS
jgi:surface antigen